MEVFAHRMRQRRVWRDLNAFTYEVPDAELNLRVDRAKKGPLQGQLFGIKANICVAGWPCDAASRALKGYIPRVTAPVVARIEAQGAVPSGLNNMDEFAMGSDGSTSAYGPTWSPWGIGLSPGGSSSGGAVAVATGMVFAALGSDTGGSGRLPAAYTGIVGFKPSRGAISRRGLIAYASSLDSLAILAKTVGDVEIVSKVACGVDEGDETCSGLELEDKELRPCVRLCIPEEFVGVEGLHQEVKMHWQLATRRLLDTGLFSVHSVSLPNITKALPAYCVIALSEASSNLARYDGVRFGYRTNPHIDDDFISEYSRTRTEGFGDEVQRRILMGVLASSEDNGSYNRAVGVRAAMCQDFEKVFAQVDILLFPTAPTPPQKIDIAGSEHSNGSNNSVTSFLQDIMTVPASMAGLPAISVPVGVSAKDGRSLPVGMQIVGRRKADSKVFAVAKVLERVSGFQLPHFQIPELREVKNSAPS